MSDTEDRHSRMEADHTDQFGRTYCGVCSGLKAVRLEPHIPCSCTPAAPASLPQVPPENALLTKAIARGIAVSTWNGGVYGQRDDGISDPAEVLEALDDLLKLHGPALSLRPPRETPPCDCPCHAGKWSGTDTQTAGCFEDGSDCAWCYKGKPFRRSVVREIAAVLVNVPQHAIAAALIALVLMQLSAAAPRSDNDG